MLKLYTYLVGGTEPQLWKAALAVARCRCRIQPQAAPTADRNPGSAQQPVDLPLTGQPVPGCFLISRSLQYQ